MEKSSPENALMIDSGLGRSSSRTLANFGSINDQPNNHGRSLNWSLSDIYVFSFSF